MSAIAISRQQVGQEKTGRKWLRTAPHAGSEEYGESKWVRLEAVHQLR
jgi:hypothetical protein